MRCVEMLSILFPIILMAGCGGSGSAERQATEAAAVGPHGGAALALPDNRGRAEVVLEASGKGSSKQIVAVYFFGDDMKSPIASPPETVEAKIKFPGQGPVAVSLARDGAKGDAAAVRFASKPGDYAVDPLVGTLNVTLGGQSQALPFSVGGR